MQRYATDLFAYSSGSKKDQPVPFPFSPAASSPLPQASSTSPAGTPISNGFASKDAMASMGAYDAYGGRLSSSAQQYQRQQSFTTHAQQAQHPSQFFDYRPQDSDTETESGDVETETEGGWTTDDEPTIRPPNSSSSGSEADTRSIASTDTEDSSFDVSADVDIDGSSSRDDEDEAMMQRTPEQSRNHTARRAGGGGGGGLGEKTPALGSVDRDHAMDSP